MKKLIIAIPLLLFLGGCNLEETNENPNVPGEVPLSTLLPPSEKGIADALGGRTFRYTNIFSQHMKGVNNQELLTENYQPDELFVGYLWQDLYTVPMIDLNEIIKRADNESAPHYAGIARVLMAECTGTIASIWGPAPYSEAFQGGQNLQPAYDSQEELYATIQRLLDEAIIDLNAPSPTAPGADDIIFGGDADAWIRVAHAMKARYYMHLVKKDEDAASKALPELQEGLTGPEGNLAYPYLGSGADNNPIAGYFEITPDALVDQSFTNRLDSLNDPRREYMTATIPFTGGNKKPGDAFATSSAPINMCSYTEQKFLESEVHLRLQDQQSASEALEAGIVASAKFVSMGQLNADSMAGYIDEHAQLDGSFQENLETIMWQKYIALFTTQEPWTDFRRTGYPQLEPNPDGDNPTNPGGDIPRRLIYPQTERLRNSNSPSPIPNMQNRFWWDE